MKIINLFFVFLFTINSISAQFSFDLKEIKTVGTQYDNKYIKTEKVDGKFTINSDSTELVISVKTANYKEKIGKICHSFENSEITNIVFEITGGHLSIFKTKDGRYLAIIGSDNYHLYYYSK